MPSLRGTRKLSKRTKGRLQSRSQKYSKVVTPTLPTLETVLTYLFNVGGHEIRKKEPAYEPPTAKDFLQEVQVAFRSSVRQSAGGSNKVRVFAQKLVGATVGTFDTPCATLLSYFAIVVWAAFFYTLAVSFFQLPSSQLADAFANPVFAMLELLQGRIGSGMAPLRQLKDTIRVFVDSTLPNVNHMAGSGIQQAILFLFNSEAYKRLVESSLACLLLRLGIGSCREKCREHTFLRE
jgi:hypothetical protein